jgi:GNAT superfamily N-acetyltransferase
MSLPVFRPATIDDAELAADLATAALPRLPEDPILTRLRWANPRPGWSYARFIAEVDGHSVASLAGEHGPWDQLPDRDAEFVVYLDRAVMSIELLTLLAEWIEERCVADGARTLTTYAAVDEPELQEVLGRLGYVREREEKMWELDLVKHGQRLKQEAEVAAAAMRAAGVRLTTMGDWGDPDAMRKLHKLDELTVQDIPHSRPILPEDFEHFATRMSFPDRPADRQWIAVQEGRPVALSYLKYPPVRGHVWTGYTCTHPGFRGRGIARAIKLQSIKQAIELGIPNIGTDNDAENAPMLHINEKLGYDRAPGWFQFAKAIKR